jgi:hypothetical protein
MDPIKAISARIKDLKDEVGRLEKARDLLQPPQHKDYAPDELVERVESLLLSKHLKRGREIGTIAKALDVSYGDVYKAIKTLWKSKKVYQTNTPAKNHKRYAHTDKRESTQTKAEAKPKPKAPKASKAPKPRKSPNLELAKEYLRKHPFTTAPKLKEAGVKDAGRILRDLTVSGIVSNKGNDPNHKPGQGSGRPPILYESRIYENEDKLMERSEELSERRQTNIRPGEGVNTGRLW